jgi:hypothetical protein
LTRPTRFGFIQNFARQPLLLGLAGEISRVMGFERLLGAVFPDKLAIAPGAARQV